MLDKFWTIFLSVIGFCSNRHYLQFWIQVNSFHTKWQHPKVLPNIFFFQNKKYVVAFYDAYIGSISKEIQLRSPFRIWEYENSNPDIYMFLHHYIKVELFVVVFNCLRICLAFMFFHIIHFYIFEHETEEVFENVGGEQKCNAIC